jgi:hypothetical protein
MTENTYQVDTVERATETPETEQPYEALGVKDDEYARIREILGRRPTSSELAMYSVMWSEHCSYKSSRVHLKQFGEKAPEVDFLLVGPGENAGVVDVGEDLAVTFKIESHNHPSYVEPYQGAATGRRRHRARHPDDGRAADRRARPAALRPGGRGRHPPGAAGRGARHRRLRQLRSACRTSAARSSSTPATPATRW